MARTQSLGYIGRFWTLPTCRKRNFSGNFPGESLKGPILYKARHKRSVVPGLRFRWDGVLDIDSVVLPPSWIWHNWVCLTLCLSQIHTHCQKLGLLVLFTVEWAVIKQLYFKRVFREWPVFLFMARPLWLSAAPWTGGKERRVLGWEFPVSFIL